MVAALRVGEQTEAAARERTRQTAGTSNSASTPARSTPHHLYFSDAPGWRVLDRDGPKILAIERGFQNGSVVLFSESRDFSNESTVKLDRLALVSAAIGPNTRVVFDEQHFGIAESGSVVGLARRFRLTGMAARTGPLRRAVHLEKRRRFPAARRRAAVRNARRPHLASPDCSPCSAATSSPPTWPPPAGTSGWQATAASVSPERNARAEAILRDRAGRPLEAVREIQTVLHSKGEL